MSYSYVTDNADLVGLQKRRVFCYSTDNSRSSSGMP